MIIKDKPFRLPACQAMACRFYYPAVVFLNEVAIPESIFCTQGLVRRWSGFPQLEAYQVRLSQYLVRYWSIRKSELFPIFPAWDDPRSEGGVW